MSYHVVQTARENYKADMLYVVARGMGLSSSARPFSAYLRKPEKKQADDRSGKEILGDVLAALRTGDDL